MGCFWFGFFWAHSSSYAQLECQLNCKVQDGLTHMSGIWSGCWSGGLGSPPEAFLSPIVDTKFLHGVLGQQPLRACRQKLQGLSSPALNLYYITSTAFYWPIQVTGQPAFKGQEIRLYLLGTWSSHSAKDIGTRVELCP